jgi:hypothetical protein
MTLCANQKCRAPLTGNVWPGGACSASCALAVDSMGPRDFVSEDDPVHRREIDATRDAIDRLADAFATDPRLPGILFLRNKGWSIRRAAARLGLRPSTVNNLLEKWNTQRVMA